MRWFALMVMVAACESLPDSLVDAPVSNVDAPPVVQVDYAGTYQVTGTWDLSRPFGPDGIGGVVADLMIDRIVMLAGVPSSLQDEAREAIAARVRAPIVMHVNGLVPEEMIATHPTMVALADLLSDIQFASTMTFAVGGDPDRFTGREVITAVAVQRGDVIYPVRMGELLDGAVTVEAAFAGRATGAARLAVDVHPIEIHYGQLVALAARDALGVDVAALAAQAWGDVMCPGVVDSFTAGGGFMITVAGQEFSVSNASLVGGCDTVKAMLEDHVLGMFRRDAGMSLGGPVAVTAGSPPTIASEAGYGGSITLFPVFAPMVTASFSGAP